MSSAFLPSSQITQRRIDGYEKKGARPGSGMSDHLNASNPFWGQAGERGRILESGYMLRCVGDLRATFLVSLQVLQLGSSFLVLRDRARSSSRLRTGR